MNDSYQVHARLGSGTTGAVFRGTDTATGQTVILKALHPDLAAALDLDAFRAQVKKLAALEHPAVPKMALLDSYRGDTVLVRDYLQGVDLATLVAGSSPPLNVATTLLADLASGLAAVMERTGLRHGDLKPSNVFVVRGGGVKVVDFGLAQVMPEHTERTLTMFHGSVGFMSPERADNQPHDASDVYSLALLAYWLITGESPKRTSANPKRQKDQTAELLDAVARKETPPVVLSILADCTRYDPEDRPSIAEVAQRFSAVAAALEGPAVASWAGPLVEALVSHPLEDEITDAGQPLSRAEVDAPMTFGAPVSKISTVETPEDAGPEPLPPRRLGVLVGAVALVLAVLMLVGAVAIASRA